MSLNLSHWNFLMRLDLTWFENGIVDLILARLDTEDVALNMDDIFVCEDDHWSGSSSGVSYICYRKCMNFHRVPCNKIWPYWKWTIAPSCYMEIVSGVQKVMVGHKPTGREVLGMMSQETPASEYSTPVRSNSSGIEWRSSMILTTLVITSNVDIFLNWII